MKSVTVRFADDTSQEFTVDTAETTNEALRLYGAAPKLEQDIDESPLEYLDRVSSSRPLLGQFRLRGEGSITGWWFSEAETAEIP